MKKQQNQEKKQALISALVKVYGDESVINRAQILAIYRLNKSAYPHPVCIEKNQDHRVGRNQYIICEDLDKTIEVRDEIIAKNEKRENQKLPPAIRNDALALVKVIKATPEPTPKIVKKVTVVEKKSVEMGDEFLSEDELYDAFEEKQDIDDIMKSMGYNFF